MGDLLIRNVPKKTIDSLKARAKQHHRSLQAEALEVLEQATVPAGTAIVEWLKTIRKPTGVPIETVVQMIREDRDTR